MAKKKARNKNPSGKSADQSGLPAAIGQLRKELEHLRADCEPDTDPVAHLSQTDATLSPIRDVLREHIETVLRSLSVERRPPLEEGQRLARSVNDLLAAYGLRLRFPDTDAPATLAYIKIGTAKPAAYVLRGVIDGRRQVHYLSQDFSQLEVMPVPPDKRRHRSISE